MGRESPHSFLVIKARYLSDSAFCTEFSRLEVPMIFCSNLPLFSHTLTSSQQRLRSELEPGEEIPGPGHSMLHMKH